MGIEQAKRDMIKFLQKEWAVDLIVDNNQGLVASVRGLASKHHLGIDMNTGLPVNTKNTHCSIAEKNLVDAGFTVRNGSGEVSMLNWKITWKDASGNSVTYVINETMPSETLGVIVCYLGDYE